MLKYEITARLDSKEIDIFVDKGDVSGSPLAYLFIGSQIVASTTPVDESTRWRLTFTSGQFNPINQDFTIKMLDDGGVFQVLGIVNMAQSYAIEVNGAIFNIYLRIDESASEIGIGGFYNYEAEPGGSSVEASKNGGFSWEAAPKIGTSPDEYEEVYSSVSGSVIPQVRSNGLPAVAVFKSIMTNECLIDITSVSVDNPAGDNNKELTINTTSSGLSGSLEFSITKNGTGGYSTPYQASNVFENLSPGTYTAFARDNGNTSCEDSLQVVINNNLAGVLQITDVSTAGAMDGAINVNVTAGSGSYSYAWLDGPITSTRSGLVAGQYEVTVTDLVTAQEIILIGVVNNPSVIPDPGEREPYFEVPKTQSLHFAIEPASIDNVSTFQQADNILLRNFDFYGFSPGNYCQKKIQNDNFKIQFRSNLENHEVKLSDYDETEILSFVPEKVVEYLGVTEDFNIRIQNHGGMQSRIYFIGELVIPVPVEVGDGFEIFNNADGFNGTYTVQGIETDLVTNEQYLIIEKNYTLGTSSTNAEGRFLNEDLTFDIYEFSVSLATVPEGIYKLTIRAFKTDLSFDQTAESEPIYIKFSHPETNLFQFTNIDNAFDIDYQNNIIHSVRVESHLYQRQPAGDSETLRNTDGSLALLSAKPQRKFNIQLWNLPPYLHELLFLGFKHDVVLFNGMPVIAEDSYGEPEYRDRNLLSNSSIIVESAKWFETYNGDDLGGISIEGGFIIANNGFIKRT